MLMISRWKSRKGEVTDCMIITQAETGVTETDVNNEKIGAVMCMSFLCLTLLLPLSIHTARTHMTERIDSVL